MRGFKEVLRARRGWRLPCDGRPILGDKWSASSKGVTISVLRDEQEKKDVAEYMKEKFYNAAAIPASLGLNRHRECDVTRRMVDREVNLFVNSGISCAVREGGGVLAGGAFFAHFPRNKDYEVIRGVSMADWHNTAAEIVAEEGGQFPAVAWREFQYEHVYNLCQERMSAVGADFAVYYAIIYFDPGVRAGGLRHAVSKAVEEAVLAQNGTPLVLCTFDALTDACLKTFAKPVVLDRVAYSDQKLVLNGEPVLQKYSDLGGITFVSADK